MREPGAPAVVRDTLNSSAFHAPGGSARTPSQSDAMMSRPSEIASTCSVAIDWSSVTKSGRLRAVIGAASGVNPAGFASTAPGRSGTPVELAVFGPGIAPIGKPTSGPSDWLWAGRVLARRASSSKRWPGCFMETGRRAVQAGITR